MAQQHLRYGASENDGTGDPFRDFAEKTESNFSELYRRIERLLEGADADIDTMAKVAAVIHTFYDRVNAVPSAAAIYMAIADAAAAVTALVPTPEQIQTNIANAIAAAVATQLAIIAAGPVVSVNGRKGEVTVSEMTPAQAQAIADNTAAIAAHTTALATNATAIARAERIARIAFALGA